MKKVYYFMACTESLLTSNVVLYYLRVGRSVRDSKALRWLHTFASGNSNVFFSLANDESSTFISNVRQSLMPIHAQCGHLFFMGLRQVTISAPALVSILKRTPLALLNSQAVTSSNVTPVCR